MMAAAVAVRMRILLIENDHRVGAALLDVLSLDGHEVSGAVDGHEAWAALHVPPAPEVLLLNPDVPHAQGAEFLQLLKGAFDAGVPVLVRGAKDVRLMTAPGKPMQAERAQALEALRQQVSELLAALRA